MGEALCLCAVWWAALSHRAGGWPGAQGGGRAAWPWGPLHPHSWENGKINLCVLGQQGGGDPRLRISFGVSVPMCSLSYRGGAEAQNVLEPPHEQH